VTSPASKCSKAICQAPADFLVHLVTIDEYSSGETFAEGGPIERIVSPRNTAKMCRACTIRCVRAHAELGITLAVDPLDPDGRLLHDTIIEAPHEGQGGS